MAVIVHKNEPIDQALKRLHREVIRENVLDTVRKKQYYVKPTTVRSEKRKEFKKQKVKRRQANRRLRQKHQ